MHVSARNAKGAPEQRRGLALPRAIWIAELHLALLQHLAGWLKGAEYNSAMPMLQR